MMGKYFACSGNSCTLFLDEEDSVWILECCNKSGTPQRIPELVNIAAIATGFDHVICLSNDGRLWGKGDNSKSQLGLPECYQKTKDPLIIPDIPKMINVDCGAFHTICLDTDKRIYSFGSSGNGQLGRGCNPDSRPNLIEGIQNVKEFSCGGFHNIVLCEDGTLYSFGRNDIGQLGLGDQNINIAIPQKVTNLQDVDISAVCCGLLHSLLLTSTGDLFGCGINQQRELFVYSPLSMDTFCRIENLPPIHKIGASDYSSFAVDENGTLWISGEITENILFERKSFEDLEERICEISKGGSSIWCRSTSGKIWVCGSIPGSKKLSIDYPKVISSQFFTIMGANSTMPTKSARK